MLMYEYIISLNQINAQTENCDMDTTANGHDDNNSNDGPLWLEFQLAEIIPIPTLKSTTQTKRKEVGLRFLCVPKKKNAKKTHRR